MNKLTQLTQQVYICLPPQPNKMPTENKGMINHISVIKYGNVSKNGKI